MSKLLAALALLLCVAAPARANWWTSMVVFNDLATGVQQVSFAAYNSAGLSQVTITVSGVGTAYNAYPSGNSLVSTTFVQATKGNSLSVQLVSYTGGALFNTLTVSTVGTSAGPFSNENLSATAPTPVAPTVVLTAVQTGNDVAVSGTVQDNSSAEGLALMSGSTNGASGVPLSAPWNALATAANLGILYMRGLRPVSGQPVLTGASTASSPIGAGPVAVSDSFANASGSTSYTLDIYGTGGNHYSATVPIQGSAAGSGTTGTGDSPVHLTDEASLAKANSDARDGASRAPTSADVTAVNTQAINAATGAASLGSSVANQASAGDAAGAERTASAGWDFSAIGVTGYVPDPLSAFDPGGAVDTGLSGAKALWAAVLGAMLAIGFLFWLLPRLRVG